MPQRDSADWHKNPGISSNPRASPPSQFANKPHRASGSPGGHISRRVAYGAGAELKPEQVVTAIRNKTGLSLEGAGNVSLRVAVSRARRLKAMFWMRFFGLEIYFLAIGRPIANHCAALILTVRTNPERLRNAPAQPAAANQGDEEEFPRASNTGGGEPQDTCAACAIPQQPQAETPRPAAEVAEQLLQELQQMRRDKVRPRIQTNNPNPAPRKMRHSRISRAGVRKR